MDGLLLSPAAPLTRAAVAPVLRFRAQRADCVQLDLLESALAHIHDGATEFVCY